MIDRFGDSRRTTKTGHGKAGIGGSSGNLLYSTENMALSPSYLARTKPALQGISGEQLTAAIAFIANLWSTFLETRDRNDSERDSSTYSHFGRDSRTHNC